MQRRIAVAAALLVAMLAGVLCLDVSPGPQAPGSPRQRPAALNLPRLVRSPFAPEIRVCLSDEPVARLEISIDGPYRLQPVGAPQELGRGARLAASTVTATASGIQIGRQQFAASRLEIVPERSPAIWVDGHQYRGRVRLLRQPGGRLRAVNVLPLDAYVASVLDSEMPAAFPDEARRAQAIVARTYVLWQCARRHPEFDVYASTRSQRYLGFQYRTAEGRRLAGESPGSRRLAQETAGMVCTHRGRLFCTYYSAVCGGRTVAGRAVFEDAPELPPVACPWCRDAALHRWTRTVPRAEFDSSLAELFAQEKRPFGTLRSITARAQSDGTVELAFSDGRREHRIDASVVRARLARAELPSPRFTIELSASEATFHGRGHGHGVGFCQWGGRGLALAGRSAREILAHYYPGTEVVALDGDGG